MSSPHENPHRWIFARQILAKAGIAADDRLAAAFAAVPRERFLGPPPWMFSDGGTYRELASADPQVLYQDIVIGLDTHRGVNNGQPSLHAGALHLLGIRDGETVVHLGAGTGYYAAILAELVGSSGTVMAVEYDAGLAARARSALAASPQVEVVHGNAFDWPRDDADAIYANFATDHPPQRWVDALAPGGRLLFPFGIPGLDDSRSGSGRAPFSRTAAFLRIDRRPRGFAAQFLMPVSFIWAEGQDPVPDDRHARLAEVFRSRRHREVRSLRWRTPPKGEEWYGEPDWGLSFDEV